jgi:hypothetical protein
MWSVILVFFLGFVQPAAAITKCELNGKVIYKTGNCPKDAVTKFLVKGNYVSDQHLLAHRKRRAQESNSAFEKLNAQITQEQLLFQKQLNEVVRRKKVDVVVEMSDESGHFQLRKVKEPASKPDKDIMPNVSNDQRLGLERQLKESEKALQQLQQ